MTHLHLLTKAGSTLLLSALILGGFVPPASAAWTTACLWNGISASDRAAYVNGMTQGQKTAFATQNPARMKATAEACGVTKTDAVDAQKAFVAYGSGLGALAALESRHGITRAQALTAWAALPAGDRARMVAIARNMHNEPQKVAVLQSVSAQMGERLDLGADATPLLRQLVYALALLQSLGRGGIAQ